MMRRTLPSILGFAVLIMHAMHIGFHLNRESWAALLVALAILVLAPMLFEMAVAFPQSQPLGWAVAVAGLIASFSLVPSRGIVAAAHVLPWLLATAAIAWSAGMRVLQRGTRPIGLLAIDSGLIFLPVGAVWLLFDRAGIRPLAFDAQIVLLTAVHFHYAGFALPILTGMAARALEKTSWRVAANVACIGVIAGVPLTAIGITASQLHWTRAIETLAAWTMAGSGMLAALLYMRLAIAREYGNAARSLWGLAGMSLVGGMALAALYASRYLLPIPALDIPTMRALHGTINALGFALPATIGWILQSSRRDFSEKQSLSRP